ncbi:hypothetical protein AAKU55_005200 [Oxalobacteraceae bacterium GrIS 1.11]
MFPSLFGRRAALGLALSACAGLAAAAPAYHVEIDTASFGGAGWLDLQFNPGNLNGVLPASALATHFTGAFDGGATSGLTPIWSGDVSGSLAGGVHFGNGSSYNDLFHALNFGGKIGFDLSFSGAADPSPNLIKSLFSVSAYGADQITALGNFDGASGSLLQFSWTPTAQGGRVETLLFDGAHVTISAVPEASAWLMLVAGLGLLGGLGRRSHGKSVPPLPPLLS